jgi:flagellar motor switch protein FliM
MNNDLLTDAEMSALLPEKESDDSREKKHQAVPYNFRRPDRLSKDQVRGLYLLHDLFAHSLSSSIPLFLRAVSEVNLLSVEQQSYSEYLRGLSDPTTIFTFSVESLRGAFAVEINSSIAFPIVARMLGGAGKTTNDKRAATELELKILEGFLPLITDNYREAWKPIADLKTQSAGRETRPQMLQIVPPNEVVVAVIYQMQIGEAKGTMSICLPVAMLETVIGKFTQSAYTSNKATAPEATFALLQTLSKLKLPVSAELEEVPVSVSDLMNLKEGDVLTTNHRLEKPLKVLIGKSVKFIGQIAALEGRKAIRISEKTVGEKLQKTLKEELHSSE